MEEEEKICTLKFRLVREAREVDNKELEKEIKKVVESCPPILPWFKEIEEITVADAPPKKQNQKAP